ncbi:hypothetical protein IWQ56_000561 [Coemansia nantahalensis]|uniref:Uncharacterized protein n=1 Tax=Coemansia helicoidea TaxID=1286919 RepID=A0ACC1L9U2_9FUNG|nr:hypothetical protein IWQ56_000561 [Coemansia nantahalensis]KAJ2804076.1 hypothetical protein H4R21_001787 [Coemansia helicoidea]
MFSTMYQHIVAELSEEETASVWALVNSNGGRWTAAQMLDRLVAEHPLCLRSDLADALVACTARLRALRDKQQIQHAPQPAQPSRLPAPLPSAHDAGQAAAHQWSSPSRSPLESVSSAARKTTNVRWTPKEVDRLILYLKRTKGTRKSWPDCAELVGTKTSSQCKAKYNNMRAQEGALDGYDI